ncbi:hypothetical protein [Pseudactinotalea terrae]|uniref:hypothetical protein n=1 Tax=Pseudactinotalea terrae TaxID=1743262 RepID=UPI001390DCFA|nr:hypothetical protein [Pseudactinotalea terrae]
MTLRPASVIATPGGPTRKLVYSAMWVTDIRGGIAVCLGRPWALVHTEDEPTLQDFLEQFQPRLFSDTHERAARYDGKNFVLDEPMSPRKRLGIGRLLQAAHGSLLAAHKAKDEAWPLPGTNWTPWLRPESQAP